MSPVGDSNELIERLWDALARAFSATGQLVQTFDDLRDLIWPAPADLRYHIPEENGSRSRSVPVPMPSGHGPYWSAFDRYHRSVRYWQDKIEHAQSAVNRAAHVIDGPVGDPFQRTSVRIRESLQQAQRAVPVPISYGVAPPINDYDRAGLLDAYNQIGAWCDKVWLLVPAADVADEVPIESRYMDPACEQASGGPPGADSSQIMSAQHPEPDNTRPANTGDDGLDDADSFPPWRSKASGGMPLRGWADICAAIGATNDRSGQRRLRVMNESTNGPIRTVRVRPEADPGELKAWVEDIQGIAEAAGKKRASHASAKKELAERGGIRQRDYSMHSEVRPNARGMARPAPDTA